MNKIISEINKRLDIDLKQSSQNDIVACSDSHILIDTMTTQVQKHALRGSKTLLFMQSSSKLFTHNIDVFNLETSELITFKILKFI